MLHFFCCQTMFVVFHFSSVDVSSEPFAQRSSTSRQSWSLQSVKVSSASTPTRQNCGEEYCGWSRRLWPLLGYHLNRRSALESKWTFMPESEEIHWNWCRHIPGIGWTQQTWPLTSDLLSLQSSSSLLWGGSFSLLPGPSSRLQFLHGLGWVVTQKHNSA